MNRLYFESYGERLLPSLTVPAGTSYADVLAMLPGIRLRPPTRWESVVDSIVDARPGRVVSIALREPPIEDWEEAL